MYGHVEKHNKRHSEERSDVAISLAFNIRDCHAVARNDIMKARLQKQEYIPAENFSSGSGRRMEAHNGEHSI
jgi:hypothetical protein